MFDEPTFLVQIGHNGHKLTTENVKKGYADGGILSPADYKKGKNKKISATIRSHGGTVLFDPQFYIPRAERPDLSTYDYFDDHGGDEFDTAGVSSEFNSFCRKILNLQDELKVDAYIAPARFLDTFSKPKVSLWKEMTGAFLKIADEEGRDIPTLASLPIYQVSLADKEQRSYLLNEITEMDPDGFYISAEFENDQRYPLTGSSDVYALLQLLNILKKNRYDLLVGHTHQIAHVFFGIGINAFASGHYQNLRAFDTRRWDPEDEQGGGRIVIKYYSDELLNELRVDPEMDLMYQKDDFDIESIRTESPYDEPLFDPSIPPSTAGWKLRDGSWDHYIWCCNKIAERYKGVSEEERLELAKSKITEASNLYEELSETFGMLSEPEPAIYSDWEDALSLIESEL